MASIEPGAMNSGSCENVPGTHWTWAEIDVGSLRSNEARCSITT